MDKPATPLPKFHPTPVPLPPWQIAHNPTLLVTRQLRVENPDSPDFPSLILIAPSSSPSSEACPEREAEWARFCLAFIECRAASKLVPNRRPFGDSFDRPACYNEAS
jgi:hypothetical protein